MKKVLFICAFILLLTIAGNSVVQADTLQISAENCGGKLCNPLRYNNIQELLPALLDIVAQIGLVICTFFIILAGFKYVTAGGNPGEIEKAHKILLWAVVGTAVLLGAKVLASILGNTVNQIIKS